MNFTPRSAGPRGGIARLTLGLALILAGTGVHRAIAPALAAEPASASAASSGPGASSVAEIDWKSSFDRAMEQARAEQKFVMVDFFTYWCYWCKVLDQKTFSNPKVIDASARLVNVKVNAESETAVARKYGVRAYPTIVFLNPDGSIRQRIQGFQGPENMTSIITDVLKTDTEVAALSQQVKDNPKDAGIRRSYVLALSQGGRYREAAAETERLLEELGLSGEDKASLELDRWLYLQRAGDGESARKGLEGWIKKQKRHPRNLEARYFLAREEETEGRSKDARKHYEEVAREGSGSWYGLEALERLGRKSGPNAASG